MRIPTTETDPDAVTVVPPNQSQPEQITWDFLQRVDPGEWIQQYPIFAGEAKGSTHVDFVRPTNRIALFVDGWYFHARRTASDEYISAIVESQGWRVVRWTVYSNAHLRASIEDWYRRDLM